MTPNTYYIFFQHPLDKEQRNPSKIHPLQGNQVPASIANRNRDLPTWKQIGFVSLTFNFSAFYVHQAQYKSQCFRALQYLSRSARPPVFYLPSFCMPLQQLRPLHISPAFLFENKSISNRVTCSVGYRLPISSTAILFFSKVKIFSSHSTHLHTWFLGCSNACTDCLLSTSHGHGWTGSNRHDFVLSPLDVMHHNLYALLEPCTGPYTNGWDNCHPVFHHSVRRSIIFCKCTACVFANSQLP